MTAADLSSDSPTADATSSEAPDGELVLRFLNTDHAGQWIRLEQAKCSVGSSDSCTLCLRTQYVKPLHALIVRGRERTVLRSYAADLRVNGRAMETAMLAAGDTLSFGTVDLLVAALDFPADSPTDRIELPEHVSNACTEPEAMGRQKEIEDSLNSLSRAKQVNRARTRRLICDLRDANERIVAQQDRLEESNRHSEMLESRLNSLEHRLSQLQCEYENLTAEKYEAIECSETIEAQRAINVEQQHAICHEEEIGGRETELSNDAEDGTEIEVITGDENSLLAQHDSPVANECDTTPEFDTLDETTTNDEDFVGLETAPQDPGQSASEPQPESDQVDQTDEQAVVTESASTGDDPEVELVEPTPTPLPSLEGVSSPFFEAVFEGSTDECSAADISVLESQDASETMALTPDLAVQLGLPFSAEQDTSDQFESQFEADSNSPEERDIGQPFSATVDQELVSEGEDSTTSQDVVADESRDEELVDSVVVKDSDTQPMTTSFAEQVSSEEETQAVADNFEDTSRVASLAEDTQVSPEAESMPPFGAIDLHDEGDEESIETYMAKLLQRVRGEVDSAPTAPSLITPPPSLAEPPEEAPQEKPLGNSTLEEAFADQLQARDREFSSPTVVRRSEAPEGRNDLAAMRELANTSARSAIRESQKRREMQDFAVQAIGAIFGFLAGVASIRMASSLSSPALFFALACWGFSAFMAYRATIWYRMQATPKTNGNDAKGPLPQVDIVPPEQEGSFETPVEGDSSSESISSQLDMSAMEGVNVAAQTIDDSQPSEK